MAEKLDSINGFLDDVSSRARRSVDVAQEIVGDNKNVTVKFEKVLTDPKRVESPRRAHVFNTVSGFAAYLKRFGSENVVILADPKTGCARATLDEKAVGGFEVVDFQPIVHPFWEPWKERLGKVDEIKPFAEFVSSQKHVIKRPSPQDLFMVLSRVRLSKKVTVESGIGAKALNGIMVETEVQGNSVKNRVDLPDSIVVACPIFWGDEPAEIEIDMLVRAGDDVKVKLMSSDAERKRIESIESMMGTLTNELSSALVTFGTIDHTPWKYVQDSVDYPYSGGCGANRR